MRSQPCLKSFALAYSLSKLLFNRGLVTHGDDGISKQAEQRKDPESDEQKLQASGPDCGVEFPFVFAVYPDFHLWYMGQKIQGTEDVNREDQ